ncbi:MAG: molybdopterin-guanine dinucleotide biosynthesis protein MobB [Pantoea sp.]|nr:molybdopterin-guanine dinucleotide biosynthesis protein MobB [Pantoea sp.]
MLPILAIAAWSGTGKTTLLKQLIPLLKEQGVRPGLIKHTHHDMDVDKPGKDSYELRKAGADQVLVASQQRWALMTETPDQEAIDFNFLISRMDSRSLDLILVEGFKDEPIPRIVLCRDRSEEEIKPLLDAHVIAVASNRSFDVSVPLLNLNDPVEIAKFIVRWLEGGC